MKSFVSQFEGLQKELGDTSKWFGKFNDFLNQIQQGSLTAAEAVAKLREEVAARAAEETRLAKEQEDAERHTLELAQQRAAEEARIAAANVQQSPHGSSGTKQEIKSQEELRKEIEDTNRVIKIQKQWLEYLNPVLDDENFKTSGKREATEQLRSKTSHLVDVRRHPEQYAHLEMYAEKAEVAWAKAYKEAERQGVAQSTLNRYYTDAGYAYDENIKKLQEERAWHAKILEDEENKLAVLQQQMQAETNIEKVRKHNFSRTINGKSGKFSMKKPGPESHETESGQMSMLPAVEAETAAKNKLANANEKVAKSQKKIKEEVQGTQTTMLPSDGLVDMTPDEVDEWLNGLEEAKGFDKVGDAADKAAGKKKKFAKFNKEVAASVTPSVEGLETEADAMEDVGEAAKKTNRVISEEAKSAAESMNFSTRDYEKLYDEMEAFAEQRKAENGYDLSKVSVNTDAHGNPLGATISYYKKATKETITETFKIDKAAQEAEDGVNRLVLSSRKATAGIADFEKATLGAINRQDQLIAQKNKTISSLSGAIDPNANRTLFGTQYEEEAKAKIQAIRDEVAKLDQEINGERVILSEKDFLATKRRIAELTQEAGDFIVQSKNAEYAPTQLESHSVSSGNQYREDQLKAQMNEWKRAGIYVGDLKKKADELAKSVTKITKHEDLKKYLEGMKEARALAKLATQDKSAEANQMHKLFDLQKRRNEIASQLNKLDPSDTAKRTELIFQMREAQDEYNEALSVATEEQKRQLQMRQEQHRAQIRLTNAGQIDSTRKREEAASRRKEEQEKARAERIIEERKKKEEKYEAWWLKTLREREMAEKRKEEKPYRDYGKTTANSVVRKRDNLQGEIDALGVTNPEVLAKIDTYKAKVQEVVDLRDQFANDPTAAQNTALVNQFQKASVEAERARRGIKAVIDEEQKMMQLSSEQGFDPLQLSADQMTNLQETMKGMAKSYAEGRVEIKGWNDDHTKMYYTVTNSKGVVEEMTMALGQGKNMIYQYRTATKETGTLIQQIFKGIQTKAKELVSFVIGGGSVYKVIELLRQGIQYVREIDLALTELKKVTDETEESYDRFLETAAKTGARLGSTISAVTEATATFAKLGYSMEQATEMAEAAIVYKNVGDNIASTEDAADSIISTMKGFGLEASESMAIVDRFNEVGNRFAITSQGIGEALRLSASALSEGGNSLDESIALITAANEVVNDPSSVGTALKTLTLRLRGSKTELEEMGEDVTDMATTTSALQAKLLALTGGQVDIMLDANTFKNSTQILREMAAAWEDMNDIQRASALELMGGRLLPLCIEICA